MTALDESIVDPNNEQVKGLLATFILIISSFYFPGGGRLSGSDLQLRWSQSGIHLSGVYSGVH